MSVKTIPAAALDLRGDGPAVVLLHGLGGSLNVWEPFVRSLQGRARTLRYDLRGSGRHPADGPLSVAGWVADLDALLQAQHIERAIFIGHSLGTLIVQHFAAAQPERVAAMALLGVNRSPPEARRAAVRQRAEEVRANGIASVVDALIDSVPSALTRATKPAAIAAIRELVCGQSDAGYAWTCEAMAASTRPDLSRCTAPLLLIAGDQDTVSPAELSRTMAAEFPHAELHVLPDCGHWLPLEQPELVNPLLAAFVARHASAAGG